jgi:hypothetical protein
VVNQRAQIMAGSAIGTQQLEHRLGTTVIVAILSLEHNPAPANPTENGNQSCQLVNVRGKKRYK